MSGVLRKMNLEVDLEGDGLQELSDWIKKLHEARTGGQHLEGVMNDMQREMKKYGVNINETISHANNFSTALKGIAGYMGARKIIGMGADLIQVAADYETAGVSFEVMLGSADKAQAIMKDLNKFSIETPFEPKQVNAAAQTLLQFNVAQEDLLGSMRMIGDVASGTGKSYEDLARMYGKANAMGKADNEMLQQMPVLYGQLAKQLGMTEKQVFEMASSGQIGFAHIQKAFGGLTGEGGKFFGMMDKQSKTWSGLMSTLTGNIDEVKKVGGQMLITALKPIVATLGQFLGWLTQNEKALIVLKLVFIALIPVIGVLLVGALGSAAVAAWGLVAPLLAVAWPFIVLAAVITAVIVIIDDLYQWFKGGKSIFGKWLDPLVEKVKQVRNFFFNIWNEIIAFIQSIPDRIVSLFFDLPDKLISALSSLGSEFKNYLKDILPDWAIKLVAKFSAEGIPARAGGGPVSAGRDYLVGELEPEIFRPGSSGFITPVSAIAGGSGKSGVVITIAPVINFNGTAARDDADTIINRVVQVIEEKLYQAMAMAGLEAS